MRRGNARLVQRLCDVARQSERRQAAIVSSSFRQGHKTSTINHVQRRRQQLAIDAENATLLRRLASARPVVPSASQAAHAGQRQAALTARISRCRRPLGHFSPERPSPMVPQPPRRPRPQQPPPYIPRSCRPHGQQQQQQQQQQQLRQRLPEQSQQDQQQPLLVLNLEAHPAAGVTSIVAHASVSSDDSISSRGRPLPTPPPLLPSLVPAPAANGANDRHSPQQALSRGHASSGFHQLQQQQEQQHQRPSLPPWDGPRELQPLSQDSIAARTHNCSWRPSSCDPDTDVRWAARTPLASPAEGHLLVTTTTASGSEYSSIAAACATASCRSPCCSPRPEEPPPQFSSLSSLETDAEGDEGGYSDDDFEDANHAAGYEDVAASSRGSSVNSRHSSSQSSEQAACSLSPGACPTGSSIKDQATSSQRSAHRIGAFPHSTTGRGSSVSNHTASSHRSTHGRCEETLGISDLSPCSGCSSSHGPEAASPSAAAASPEAEVDAEAELHVEAKAAVHPVLNATADAADANSLLHPPGEDEASLGRSSPPCGSSADGCASSRASMWSYDSLEEEDKEASEEGFEPHSMDD